MLPANLDELTEERQADLLAYYEEDLPSPSSVEQEVRLWRRLWSEKEVKPATIAETLVTVNQKQFPNVSTILNILQLIPVTSSSVERANSALGFIKSNRRSTMTEERMNALTLLFVHKDIALNLDKVVDMYATKHPRRMLFKNPLSEECS